METFIIIIIVAGTVLLYLGWYIHVHIFTRLKDLGVVHNYSYLDYFDSILRASIVGFVCARIGWIAQNSERVMNAGIGLLPYERIGQKFEWLPTYPWRFFAFGEGMMWPIFWIAGGVSILIIICIPTLRLIRQLKIDKKSVRFRLLLREISFMLLLIGYVGFLVYRSF